MTRKDYILMLGLVTLSGLIGGSLTSWVVSGTVIAESPNKPAKILQVEAFQIVDADGRVRIELSAKSPSKSDIGQVGFYYKDGKKMKIPRNAKAQFDSPAFHPKPRIKITDDLGKVIWSAPNETEVMFVR